ncbi:MAG: hypothetical protein KGM17_06465 [Sphingomonadales bacterium]|nr:hypothetical protein [Sphingomonadales bacterium]
MDAQPRALFFPGSNPNRGVIPSLASRRIEAAAGDEREMRREEPAREAANSNVSDFAATL